MLLQSSSPAASGGAAGGDGAGAGAGAAGPTEDTGSKWSASPAGSKLTASEALDFIVLVANNPSILAGRTAAADLLSADSFPVGTPVWMVSHPHGRRAYVSRGVITEWDAERTFFNHNIPSLPGCSGMLGGGQVCWGGGWGRVGEGGGGGERA